MAPRRGEKFPGSGGGKIYPYPKQRGHPFEENCGKGGQLRTGRKEGLVSEREELQDRVYHPSSTPSG